MEQRQAPLIYPVHGEDIEVADTRHLGCPHCGEIVFSLDQANAWSTAAVQLYRHKHGLLSADEVRALRERLGLSQSARGHRGAQELAGCGHERRARIGMIHLRERERFYRPGTSRG